MRRQCRDLDARRRANDHLVAEVDQLADLLAHQNACFADLDFAAAQVVDNGSAAFARDASGVRGLAHALKSVLLQIGNAVFKCRLGRLIIPKEHTIFIIMRECHTFFPWTKEPPARAQRFTIRRAAAWPWSRPQSIAFIRSPDGWSRMPMQSGGRRSMRRAER